MNTFNIKGENDFRAQWPKIIVVSAVNLIEGGALQVLRQCLQELIQKKDDNCRVIVLANSGKKLNIPKVEVIEFPEIKKSWLNRFVFEYWTCRALSKKLKSDLWLSMHDATPSLSWPTTQAVYCHNPMPFYRLSIHEAFLDPKIAVFALFYKYIYKINLKKNKYVIVQQKWMRDQFFTKFSYENAVVAYPQNDSVNSFAKKRSGFKFFYPAFPRVFKNFEVLLRAWDILEKQENWKGQLTITINGTENRYAKWLKQRYGHLQNVTFSGLMSHEDVMAQYIASDALLFPSKAETWGLPITEAKNAGLSIFAADLPYAHESIGDYDGVYYFDPTDANKLAELLLSFSNGTLTLQRSIASTVSEPLARGWAGLWNLLLDQKISTQ